MWTSDIDCILENHPSSRDHFIGTFARDTIPEHFNEGDCFVFNTNNSTDTKIGHWLAVFGGDQCVEVFDPLGKSSYHYGLGEFTAPLLENTKPLQGQHSTSCGQFCILYILLRCEGHTMKTIVDSVFTNDQIVNDKIVNKVVSFLSKRCN